MQTFIFSTLSTVSRVVKIRPPLSSWGLPFGNTSSITRYWHSSAFTKGATYVFLEVTTGSNSSTPSFFRSSSTDGSGLGVILSIMDHGKDTFAGFSIYSTKEAAVRPVSDHFAANVWTASNNLLPLWEQLSMLTMAIGFSPDWNLV